MTREELKKQVCSVLVDLDSNPHKSIASSVEEIVDIANLHIKIETIKKRKKLIANYLKEAIKNI